MNRREFMKTVGCVGVVGLCRSAFADDRVYPGWKEGEFDIHFIHTGTGEQTFMLFPDGTSMILDCGHVERTGRKSDYALRIPARPSAECRGGEWTSRYIQRLVKRREIDWALVSHWHDDHVMGFPDLVKDFRLLRWSDHQFPSIALHCGDGDRDCIAFAKEFIPSARAKGMAAEPFVVGARDQFHMVNGGAGKYDFEIRNLAADAVVWDGRKDVLNLLAGHVAYTGRDRIAENQLSNAIRIRYGRFSYYTGGDVEQQLFREDGTVVDLEATVGRVCGPVNVAKMNHHAYWNAMTPGFVKAVRARAWLSSTWSPNQINGINLPAICTEAFYRGPRTLYHGAMPKGKAEEPAVRPYLDTFASAQGHVVVKVAPGGGSYRIFVLDAADESMRVLAEDSYSC